MKHAPKLRSMFGRLEEQLLRPREPLLGNARYRRFQVGSHTVFARRRALDRMFREGRQYGLGSNAREIAFVCMGRRARDMDGAYSLIEALPLVALGERAEVELDPLARRAARRRYPAFDELGYVHTHPGFGVCPSAADLRTARDYGPSSINMIYDPVAEELGIGLSDQSLLRIVVGRRRRPVETQSNNRSSGLAVHVAVCAALLLALFASDRQ